jgi:hypothetical protein
MCTPIYTGLEMMPRVVWLRKFSCFISCLTCNWHSSFSQVHKFNNFLLYFLETSMLWAIERILGRSLHLSASAFVPPPSNVCFYNTELPCCIVIICFLNVVNHH